MWWLRLLAALYLLLAVSACKGAMTLAHSAGLGVADWMLGLAAFIAVIILCNKIAPSGSIVGSARPVDLAGAFEAASWRLIAA